MQKFERNFIKDFPPVRRFVRADVKKLLVVFRDQTDAVCSAVAEAKENRAVQVQLNVKIPPVLRHRGEEKLHAAVRADAAELIGQLRADVLFARHLVHVDFLVVVADLLLHAHARVRQPTNIVHLQLRHLCPVRRTHRFLDDILFHIHTAPNRFPPIAVFHSFIIPDFAVKYNNSIKNRRSRKTEAPAKKLF